MFRGSKQSISAKAGFWAGEKFSCPPVGLGFRQGQAAVCTDNLTPGVYPIETCKMNDVDPQAWLADVLARLPDHPANKVVDLLPWNWKANQQSKAAVAA
jgi:hypothetical protein